ncbi:hypothetical protein BDW22DRAFT_690055 [Trametopsis cervina]|nr:hypothetical protein BDW22DRAFT_690055 [Trametopsis cervina]
MYAQLLPRATNSSTPSSKSHNVATFAGAVGGSVGLLSLLALSLAFSLYRRRLKARRRDREYRERHYGQGGSVSTFHTESSHDGPPMQGPAPFVPRYFPGTIINTAPPPYSPPAPPSNEATSTLLEQPETPVPSMSWSSRRWGNANVESDSASYADRPPPTPPLTATANAADVEDGYFAPPPAFQAAIATPVPAILAGLSGTAVASSSSSPAPRSSTPTPPSPIIPLLAPPPSSRPVTITNISLQPPAMGPSGSHTAIVSGPGSIASPRSLRIHPSVESISLSGIDINPSSSHDSHSPLPSVPVAPSPSASTIARPTGDAEIRRSRSGESVRSGVGR